MLSQAYSNLDEIYEHIRLELATPEIAIKLVDSLEEAIFSLEEMPLRGPKRRTGAYANKGYRQLFVKNFIIVYRIDEANKQVIIVTVRYSRREF